MNLNFGPAQPLNFTYNRQKALQNWALRQHLNKRRIVLKEGGELAADDLLSTNKLDQENYSNYFSLGQGGMPNNQYQLRYNQESYELVNISSRQRVQSVEKKLTPEDRASFPDTKIWDEYWDDDNSCFLFPKECCQTFNNFFGFQGVSPCFFVDDEGNLCLRQPIDESTGEYQIVLPTGYRFIRYVRLVSVELPNEIPNITEKNNLMLLDIQDPKTGEAFAWGTGYPFMFILVPPGKYTVCDLLETIIRLLNKAVETICKEKIFSFEYNERNGSIWIKSQFQFHLRFWFSLEEQVMNISEMLGFPLPYPADDQLEPIYTNCWSNLIQKPSPLTACGLVNCVPFKCPSTDVNRYIYLVIKNFRTLQDVRLNEDIFAKIQFPTGEFTSITKVFDVPLDKLEFLDIKWLDEFGNVIDFGGLENSFTLEIVVEKDRLKNADFSSQRGLRNYETEVDRVIHKVAIN